MIDLSDLPDSWEILYLGDVLQFNYGKGLPKSKRIYGEFPVYGSNGIVGKHSSFIVKQPSLIIGRKGSIGEVHFAEKSCWPIDTTYFISDFHEQPIKYWFYQLKSLSLNKLNRASAIPGLNREDASKQIIPLPPLNEQRRIVAKIEELTTHSQKAREALDDVPRLIDRFRQSVLAAAFRGDLTADWREKNPDVESAEKLLDRAATQLGANYQETRLAIEREDYLLPKNWAWTQLKLVVRRIQPGKNFSCPEIPVTKDTVGLVKISAVTWDKFNPQETKTVVDSERIDPKLFIKKDDFLISRANTLELVGASVIVEEINYRIMLSDKVWRVDFAEVDKRYIHYFLKSSFGRKEIESRATGNQLSMRNISQKAFKEIIVPIPPIDEQRRIVEYIEKAFTSVQEVLRSRQNAVEEVDFLDRSILAKAFRGELVPQDPNDEPASVLLDRIRAEREKLGTSKKKGRTSRRKAKQDRSP